MIKNIIKILTVLKEVIVASAIIISIFLVGQCAKHNADNNVLKQCIETVKDIKKCEELYRKIKD